MSIRNYIGGAILTVPLLLTHGAQAQDQQQPPSYNILELPAVQTELAAKSLVYSVRKFGNRYFATGQRGHILFSDDGGDSWQQAEVPVRSSLLDIAFPTHDVGYAVGHEGVILKSTDAGKTWTLVYDGYRIASEGLKFYTALMEEDPDSDIYAALADEMDFAVSQGADKPLFSIHCFGPEACNAIGAYGLSIRTRNGGESWEPTMHRNENLSFYHMFDTASLPGKNRFFLVGEAGMFMIARVDEAAGGAQQIDNVPWEGSFFTATDTQDDTIVVGGLRGRMFKTPDEGLTWNEVSKPATSSIVDTVTLSDGRVVATGVAGEILLSSDNGSSFKRIASDDLGRINTLAEGPDNTLIVGGPKGLGKVKLPQ